jgi:hypothetical protein
MKRVFALLTMLMAILALFMPLALAQKSSPAGGMFLEFNGKDAFLILKSGKLLNTEFKDFTVEAWVYPRTFPKKGEKWVVATKPGTFELLMVGPNPKNPDVLAGAPFGYSFVVYTVNFDFPNGMSPFTITWPGCIDWLNNWCHIAGSFDGSSHLPGFSFQGGLSIGLFPLDDLVNIDSLFYIGRTEEWENSYFDGFIDEVRISNIMRYKDSFKTPEGPFKADEKTVALWHFDEGKDYCRYCRFKDSSGNGNTLIGGNGFPVEPTGKLSTTWTKIKSQD